MSPTESDRVTSEPALYLTVILLLCNLNRDWHSFKMSRWVCVTQLLLLRWQPVYPVDMCGVRCTWLMTVKRPYTRLFQQQSGWRIRFYLFLRYISTESWLYPEHNLKIFICFNLSGTGRYCRVGSKEKGWTAANDCPLTFFFNLALIYFSQTFTAVET